MFINRDWTRTERDDFVLNIEPRLGKYDGAIEVRTEEGQLIGWHIKPIYE